MYYILQFTVIGNDNLTKRVKKNNTRLQKLHWGYPGGYDEACKQRN